MDALTVKIKGEAKVYTKELKISSGVPGIYVLGLNSINGKLHWLQESGSNAIWYGKYGWNIGSQDEIGSDFGSIATLYPWDKASPQLATTWFYHDGSKISQLEDVLVEPGTFMIKQNKNIKLVVSLILGILIHCFIFSCGVQNFKFQSLT